jgi:hypothetical protein
MTGMLLMIGAGVIGVTWCFLLGLILASRFTTGRWLTDAAVAERITVSLIAGFAVGLICVELHPASSAAAASGTLEIALLLATLGGFALMWSWFKGRALTRGTGRAAERALPRLRIA